MKTKHVVLASLCLFLISGIAFGDRQLERAEILQILEKLTSQPTKTWISAGTIQATHEEYRAPKITNASTISTEITNEIQEYQNSPDKVELAEDLQKMKLDAIPFNVRYRLSNELTMNSTVVVKFDGNRFYWEINVDSRNDSVKPGAALQDNFMTNDFNLEWNARRIFSWDGQKYTMYSLPANKVIVDTTNSYPHVVNGPLTAGIVPWGYGLYTYKNLSAATSSATEMIIGGQTQIHLTLNNSDGSEMSFVLDAGRNYAVISHSTDGFDKVIYRQYDNYQLVSGALVPMTISIEQYDAFTNRLLATDYWNITSISGNTPSIGNFSLDYEPGALIEYQSNVTAKSALYRYSYTADTDQLLTERLDYAASESDQAQNCATAALKYAASKFDKNLTYRQLAKMVDRPGRATGLDTMKDFAERSGLYCRAVRTDVQTLKSLSECQVILHFPKKDHYVALEGIDDEYAWSVDLSKDKFYYRTDLNFLDMDWSEGTALLISDRPILLQGKSTEIADSQLSSIVGGMTRYGCEEAQSGSCEEERMVRSGESFCIVDPYDFYNCTITGEWTFFYMRACS